MIDCPECGEDLCEEGWSSEAECPNCGEAFELDWDYVGSGDSYGYTGWVVGKLEATK